MVGRMRTVSPHLVGLVLGVGLTLLILRRCLAPGYLLIRDLVFVPDPAWRQELIGLTSGLPRGVPSNLWEVLLSHAVGGQVAQRLTLVLILLAAATGTARVAADVLTAARPVLIVSAAAAAAALLNAFVAERLLIGQWVVLVGYASLGWVYLTGRRLASTWAPATLALLAASIGGAQAWVLAAPVLLIASGKHWARALPILGVAALPWALPSLIRPHESLLRSSHSELFAVRTDSPLGLIGSVATGGGIWNADAVPEGRGSAFLAVLALGCLLVATLGARTLVKARSEHIAALGAIAVVGLAVPLLSALDVFALAVDSIPGVALLRDAQRFTALWVFVVAVLFGLGIGSLCARPSLAPRVLAVAGLIALAGSSAALLGGRAIDAKPVRFPADYDAVRKTLDNATDDDAVLVLPWVGYRKPAWNGGTPFTQPFPRMLDRRVLTDGSLSVVVDERNVTAADDDPAGRRVKRILEDDLTRQQRTDALAGLGVGWVVVDAGDQQAELARVRARTVVDGRWLRLARLEPSHGVSRSGGSFPSAWTCGIGLLSWMGAGVAATSAIVVRSRRARAAPRTHRSSAST